MKVFQQCLRSNCEQLRFRYEQQQSQFQRAYIQYTQCAQQQFNILGLFKSDKSTDNTDDGNIIGGGSIGNQQQETIFSLNKNYNKIVEILENCFKSQGRNLDELDSYKDCQINCLDKALDITENKSSQSTLSTNLILAIVLSVIGFGLILLFLYKCDRMNRKQRENRLQLEKEGQCYDEEDGEIGYEKSEKELCQKRLYKAKLKYKTPYGHKMSGGLSRLDVNKMKQIVNHMKQDNPEELEEEVSFKKDREQSHHKSHLDNIDMIDSNTNYLSKNNSHFIQRQFITRNSNRRQTEKNSLESQKQQSINTITTQNLLSFGSGSFNFTSNSSNLSSYNTSSRTANKEQTNNLNQPHNSPQIHTLENKYNNIQAGDEIQKNLTEIGYSSQKDCDSNDKTQQFVCYQTSPCEAQEKYARIISPLSGSKKNIILPTQQQSLGDKSKDSSESNEKIQVSPQIKNSLETQDFTTASPELIRGKKHSIKERFMLIGKNSPRKSLQEEYDSATQINENGSDDGNNTIKVDVAYQNIIQSQSKLENSSKTQSLLDLQQEESQLKQQNGTVA